MKTKNIIFLLINILVTILCLTGITIFSYNVFKLNMIPNKYIILFYGLLLILLGILIFNIFRNSKISTKIICYIIILFVSIGCLYPIKYLNNTYKFLTSTQVKYETLNYRVVILRENPYYDIADLKDKNISYIKDNYSTNIKNNLLDKISFNETLINNSTKLFKSLLNKETDAIVLEDGYLKLATDEIENFEESTRTIYSFKIKVKAHKEDSNIDVTKDPFIIYVSGIDQFGNVNSIRGRSDVNQLIVINPKTHHILLVNTPRDYYVQLAGTTGLRDKLTHAGIYGINRSISTMENIYNIDINHYIRINFDSLVKIVDLIDGVDVESDITFKSFHIKGWTVPKGMNHFNGKQALAYSRERYAYVDGDFHRGRNQQQVMEAIIEKLTKSNVFLKNYNSILNSLNGSFQTDMDVSLITAFIKYQLDKMPEWTIDSVGANGFSSWNYTYSMGYNYYLWVMEPDWDSINSIKNQINSVLREE